MQRRRGHTWAGVGKTAQAAAAHAALFCFTLLLALRVDGRTAYSWWYALKTLTSSSPLTRLSSLPPRLGSI
jgi:hypothetical protein